MKDKARNIARKRAFYKLRDRYRKQYDKIYEDELKKLGVENKRKKKRTSEVTLTDEQIDKLIAKRMMSREYLGALMQEGVVSNRKSEVDDIEPVDVTLHPDYSSRDWKETTFVKPRKKEE